MWCSSDPVIPGPDLDQGKKKVDSAGWKNIESQHRFKSLTLKQDCDLDYMRYVTHIIPNLKPGWIRLIPHLNFSKKLLDVNEDAMLCNVRVELTGRDLPHAAGKSATQINISIPGLSSNQSIARFPFFNISLVFLQHEICQMSSTQLLLTIRAQTGSCHFGTLCSRRPPANNEGKKQ